MIVWTHADLGVLPLNACVVYFCIWNFDTSLGYLELHLGSQFYEKWKTLFRWNSVCCHSLLKLARNLFHTNTIQWRGLCWHDYMKYIINIVLCQDTCKPICFKLGMMLDMTKLYSSVWVWMTSMFTQGHRKAGTVQSLCCKVASSNSNVHNGWLYREDDCKSCMVSMDHLSICSSYFLDCIVLK